LVPSLACYAVVSTAVEWDIEMPMFELGADGRPTGVIDDVRLAHRTATAAGRARYKLRQQTVAPVFGIIKQAIGFRRFMLRGLEKVSLEWILVTLSYNLRRLYTLGAVLKAA
jgi:hypothetical protein